MKGLDARRYVAYGLGIRSEIPLPDLAPGGDGGDVDVRLQALEPVADPRDGSPVWWSADDDGDAATVTVPGLGTCLIRAGRSIAVDPVAEADQPMLRQLVVGPALALVLAQRGLPTLHASAVQVGARGVAFVGAPGSGKSSAAAAMHRRGHPVIADDAVAVTDDEVAPSFVPGVPRLKLWPAVASALGIPADELGELHAGVEKRAWAVSRGFPSRPVPATHVYVLADGPAVKIEEMAGASAAIELIRHSHGALTAREGQREALLRRAAQLTGALHVLRLERPASPDALPAVALAVEADIARTSEAVSA